MMHGELLGPGGVEPDRRRTWGPLEAQAAALYRCALLHEALRVTQGRRFGLFTFFFDQAGVENVRRMLEHEEERRRAANS